jgi:hypothetical protein
LRFRVKGWGAEVSGFRVVGAGLQPVRPPESEKKRGRERGRKGERERARERERERERVIARQRESLRDRER